MARPNFLQPVWLHDGNVILTSGNSTYRVHRSVVAANSMLLQELFAVRTLCPEDSTNPPVIEVDVAPCSLSHYINARYNGDRRYYKDAVRSSDVAVAMLTAGAEFKDTSMRDDALQTLADVYPAQLDQWDFSGGVLSKTRLLAEPATDFDVFLAFKRWGIYTGLPSAFYNICQLYSMDIIRSEISRKDGTKVSLSIADTLSCAIGRQELVAARVLHVCRWLEDETIPVDMCRQRKICRAALNGIATMNRKAKFDVAALDKWEEGWNTQMCVLCENEARRAHSQGRHRVWDMLPGFFDLPEWETLLAMQRVKLGDVSK